MLNRNRVPCMFSTGPSREHSLRKRMIANVYSKSYIQSSGPCKAQAQVILFGRLLPILQESSSHSQKPHGVDVLSIFLATTMDLISAYVFGIRHGTNFLQNFKYREHWLQLYLSRHGHPFFPQELPRLTRYLRKLGISPYPKWVDTANRELAEWNHKICQAAVAGSNAVATNGIGKAAVAEEPVVLQALLSGLQKEEVANGKDSLLYPTAIAHHDLSVSSELFDHVLAGQETAGVTLTYLAWHLSKDIDLQKRLQAELRGLEPPMEAADGRGIPTLPQSKRLDALPILHAVVMETLRLNAPIPGPQPRQTPYPSCQIGPYKVPGGVRIAALAHTLHRDERVFPEPEVWDHTRWLEAGVDEETRKERARQFWAFSSGGRMCIGSNFAMQGERETFTSSLSGFSVQC